MDLCLSQSLGSCKPTQIINFETAFDVENNISIYDECGNKYSDDLLKYAYSLDNVCWSCYMTYNEMTDSTVDFTTDYFIRIKLNGAVSKVEVDGLEISEYTTQLYSGFEFTECGSSQQSNSLYNPYANMDGAIQLQQSLVETIGCMIGIPIYYFSVNPTVSSKDITFKEYALYSVTSVKQIKLIVPDGQMPSSKPEFAEWGLDFQTDWETEIPKGMFATAFGKTAQPMEGDFIYIPMMKRMWLVAGAYEEKKDSLMWNATTFKVSLTKYIQDKSVDLGTSEDIINDIVKNKYEDLFGNNENIASSFESAQITPNKANNLYPVYMSDDIRKYMTCDFIEVSSEPTYFKGTLISENLYRFPISPTDASIIYQKELCTESASVSFVASFETVDSTSSIIEIGNKTIDLKQTSKGKVELSFSADPKSKISFSTSSDKFYLITLRWSRELNMCEFVAYPYVYPEAIPLYKLSNHHYYYDIDNPIAKASTKWNIEMKSLEQDHIQMNGFYGKITNIKVFDYYNDDLSEIMMQYPNNSHLIINDVANQIVTINGVSPM